MKRDIVHVRVVLEVALIAMARKVIIEEPNTVPSLTLFGIPALILAQSHFTSNDRPKERTLCTIKLHKEKVANLIIPPALFFVSPKWQG